MSLRFKRHDREHFLDQEFEHLDDTKEGKFVKADRAPTSSDKTEARVWMFEDGSTLKVYFFHSLQGWKLGLTL